MHLCSSTRTGPLLLLLFAVLACSWFGTSHGLVRGDLVKTSTRARYGKVETPWTGLTSKYSPRFRYEKAAHLPNPQQIKEHDFFKMSFSFMDDKFITPWITVWDAKDNIYLNYVEFVFTYSGNDIIDVDYHLDYNNDPEHAGKVLSTILLRFTWSERSAEDVDTMFAFMLCGGFLLSVGMVMYVTLTAQTSMDIQTIKNMMAEEEVPAPSSLPYVDTSSYDYSSPMRNESRFQTENQSNHSSYAAEDEYKRGLQDGMLQQQVSRDPQEELIPMEQLAGDDGDQETTVVDDFVSLETSTLPQPTSIAASTPTFLQQPIVRRKAHDEGPTSKDD